MQPNRHVILFSIILFIACLFNPAQAVDTSYVYSFDDKVVPNATISLLKQNGDLFNSWTADELGSYNLGRIKTYLQDRWSSIPNGYVFYIQVEKYPFDRTWKLQRIDATHVRVNDGNIYTTSTVWTYLKNNLKLTVNSGDGYADRAGITVTQTDAQQWRVDGSGIPTIVFIAGDNLNRYTVRHYNDTDALLDEHIVYVQDIDGEDYIVFDADEWSYYTVDGSLIEVGITDMRLAGDMVQINGNGYDRLVLPADYTTNKLENWNQKSIGSYNGGNPWRTSYGWNSLTGRNAMIRCNIGTTVLFHDPDTYLARAGISSRSAKSWSWSHITANNYYSYQFYLDSDHNANQDIVIEAYTPDHIDYFIVEMWNGTAGAYQTVLDDGVYTAANLINLNNSSTGLDFALYKSSQRGDTVSAIYGNTSKPDQTVSAYYGVINRTLMLFRLPADDGADSATSGASQVNLRLTVYYNPEGVIDNSYYTNHGTQSGGVSRVRDGQIGEAIEFDGVNDYVSADDVISRVDLTTTGDVTMCGWFKRIAGSGDSFRGFGDSDLWNNYFWIRFTDTSVKAQMRGSGGTYPIVEDFTDYSGSWVYICAVKDGGDIELFVNGISKGEDSTTGLSGDIVTTDFDIGRGYSNNYCFSGYTDEVRIYNRTINLTEIQEHYNGTFNNETGLVFHSPMELTPSGAATYEFEDSANQYYGLDNINGDTLMLFKAGTQNVTYITNSTDYTITGMTVRADENELIDRLFITYNSAPLNISAIINQSAIDVGTDSDGDDVPDAFEDANITVNKNAQGGGLKWDYLWYGAYNHLNSTGYMYYSNLINGSGLYGTEIQTASTTGTANITMNTAGAGETYNFTVNSGASDYINVTGGLSNGTAYGIYNTSLIETQTASFN